MDGVSLTRRMEEHGSIGGRNGKGKSLEAGNPPGRLAGALMWGVGVRMMSACIIDRDTEGQETDQETRSGRRRQPGATAARLLQENRVSAVGSSQETLAASLEEGVDDTHSHGCWTVALSQAFCTCHLLNP